MEFNKRDGGNMMNIRLVENQSKEKAVVRSHNDLPWNRKRPSIEFHTHFFILLFHSTQAWAILCVYVQTHTPSLLRFLYLRIPNPPNLNFEVNADL